MRADRGGVVIGLTQAPLVNRGDAIVHVAEVEEGAALADSGVRGVQQAAGPPPAAEETEER